MQLTPRLLQYLSQPYPHPMHPQHVSQWQYTQFTQLSIPPESHHDLHLFSSLNLHASPFISSWDLYSPTLSIIHSHSLTLSEWFFLLFSLSLTMLRCSRRIRNLSYFIFCVCIPLQTDLLVPLCDLQNESSTTILEYAHTHFNTHSSLLITWFGLS